MIDYEGKGEGNKRKKLGNGKDVGFSQRKLFSLSCIFFSFLCFFLCSFIFSGLFLFTCNEVSGQKKDMHESQTGLKWASFFAYTENESWILFEKLREKAIQQKNRNKRERKRKMKERKNRRPFHTCPYIFLYFPSYSVPHHHHDHHHNLFSPSFLSLSLSSTL